MNVSMFGHEFSQKWIDAALVDSLIAKTKSWEEERRKVFLYDEVRSHVPFHYIVNLKSWVEML